MDYAAFRSFRDQVAQARALVRMDCMNPAKALARWQHMPAEGASVTGDALAAWTAASGLGIDSDQLAAGEGVRDLLRATLELVDKADLWLPEDVYPVYWQLASGAPHPFATLPDFDLAFLAQTSARAVVVLPAPITPLGRGLSSDEIATLHAWLRASRERVLIIDAVYTYDFAASRPMVERLLATDQCVMLWSCTKSWLCPEGLGVAAGPATIVTRLRYRVRTGSKLARTVAALTHRPELPALQQQAFTREWDRLTPVVRAAEPSWTPPSTGYFSVLPRDHRALLEHDILAVPASVFGSPRADLSIITCLHDLVAHAR